MALDRLRASLAGSPVVKFGEYDYFVHPVTDGIPLGDPAVLEEVADALAALTDWSRVDKIVTAESMGFPLAAVLSIRTRRPYVFIRKRQYRLPGEISVRQTTGYGGTDLFVNNVRKGDRVVFVDDVVSTGGTLRAVVRALRHLGAEVAGVLIVFDKAKDRPALEEELGVRIQTLMRVEVRDGRLVERPG